MSLLLLLRTAAAPVLSFADDFNRADGPLGANWATTLNAPTIVSGQVAGSTAASAARWITPITSGMQVSQATHVTGGQQDGVAVAMPGFANGASASTSTMTWYAFRSLGLSAGHGITLKNPSAGTYTTLVSSTRNLVGGDVLRLEWDGTTLSGYINDTLTLTHTPATPLTGQYVGIVHVAAAQNGVPVLDDWSGGNTATAHVPQQYDTTGTVTVVSDGSGTAGVRATVVGTVASVTTVTGATTARLRVTGIATATSTVPGAVSLRAVTAGTTGATSAATGTANAIQQATGTITASTTTTGDADLIIGPRQYDTTGTVTVTSDTVGAAELQAQPTIPTLVDSRAGTATALTVTVTLPTYLTTDTIVLFVSSNNANAQTFSTNVTATSAASAGNRLNVWQIAPQDGAQTTFTLTIGASSVLTWWIGTYRGADPTLTAGAAINRGNNTTSVIEAIPATGTVVGDGNELVLSAFSVNSTATWATPGTVYNTTAGNGALLINADTLAPGALTAVPTDADRGLAGTSRNESTATVILVPASSTVVRNRLTNPSFEDTAATSAGWETEKTVLGTPAFTKLSTGAVDGTRVQQMQYAGQTGDSGLFAIYQSPIPATPGETLTFTIWLSGSKANCSLIVGIEGFGTGQVYISETDTTVTTLTGTMTEYTVSYTVPADAVAVACYVQANEVVASTAITAQLDKATLTGVPGVVVPSFATAGTVAATSSVTGAAGVIGAVDGSVTGTTGTTGAAGLIARTTGTTAAVTAVTGATTARLTITGTTTATTAVTGAATVVPGPQQYPAAGTVQAISGATGVATVIGGPQQYPAAGTVASTTSATGAAGVRAATTGTTVATTTTTGTAGLRATTTGTLVTATTTVTGTTGLRARTTGTTVTATTTTTGTTRVALTITGTITVTTGTLGTALQYVAVTGTVDALATITGATELLPAVIPPGPSGRIVSVRWRILAASGDLSTPDAVGQLHAEGVTGTLRVPDTGSDLKILEATGAIR